MVYAGGLNLSGSTTDTSQTISGILFGTHTWSGTAQTENVVSVTGVTTSSVVTVTINGTANNQVLRGVTLGTDQFTIRMNGDPGAGTKFAYIIINP